MQNLIKNHPVREYSSNLNPPKIYPVKACIYCGAKEGEKPPLRGFYVELSQVVGSDGNNCACQACRVRVFLLHKAIVEHKGRVNTRKRKALSFISIFFAIVMLLFLTELTFAQPGLPGAPSQAPIDGGLSLLAAAGGAYAIKKLKDKRGE